MGRCHGRSGLGRKPIALRPYSLLLVQSGNWATFQFKIPIIAGDHATILSAQDAESGFCGGDVLSCVSEAAFYDVASGAEAGAAVAESIR